MREGRRGEYFSGVCLYRYGERDRDRDLREYRGGDSRDLYRSRESDLSRERRRGDRLRDLLLE